MISVEDEERIYSQNGEDGVIRRILQICGLHNRYCVEFGTGNASVCCTRYLVQKGWKYLWLNPKGSEEAWGKVRRGFVTAENIEKKFAKHKVPVYFDVLSVDINGNDYWVWNALRRYRPRVIVIEYNGTIPLGVSATVPYDPNFSWNRTLHYGASLQALYALGLSKQYTLVYCESRGVNAFFVADEALPRDYQPQPLEQLFVSAKPGFRPDPELRMIHPITGEPVWPIVTPN